MQNLMPGMGTSRYLRKSDPIYPCNAVAERHKVYCYLMVTSRILSLDGYNWHKTADWCRRSEKGWVATCFQSYGRDASGFSQYQPQRTVRLCLEAGNDAGECLYGAARDYGNNYAGGVEAARLCNLAPARPRGRCFEGIGTILGTLHRYGNERKSASQGRHAGPLPTRLLPRRSDHLSMLTGLAARVSLWNRRRKLALFCDELRPAPRDDRRRRRRRRHRLRHRARCRAEPQLLRGAVPVARADHGRERRAACRTSPRSFRSVSCVTASGTDLPFEDDAFDIAFSNAVIEHVGGRDEQRAVRARALPRGAARVRLHPNRWFPVEVHTLMPFVHWLPRMPATGFSPPSVETRGPGRAPGSTGAAWAVPSRSHNPGRRVEDHDHGDSDPPSARSDRAEL